MLRRTLTVAALVGVAAAQFDEDDFGPVADVADDSWGYGNSSNGTNVTTTTTATTTTTQPEMPHIHLAYFVSRIPQTDEDGGNPHLENLDCNLARVGQGAYYFNLEETEFDKCVKMPDVKGENRMYYYQLKMSGVAAGDKAGTNNITSLLAFCDDSCDPLQCKISRAKNKNDTNPEASPLAYDRCEPTSVNESFSYFVRQGHGANMIHDICLLRNVPAKNAYGVTEVRYPNKNSKCDDHEPGAVVASSLRSISDDDCDVNHFDDTSYRLRLEGNRIHGVVGCADGCEPSSCQEYDGFWGQCSGYGHTKDHNNSHFKLFETRNNGMVVSDTTNPENNKGIPLCGGMAPTPTPRKPNEPTTPVPSKKKAHPYKMPAIILSSLFGAFFVAYFVFWVLRRRKLRRMSAYAALQDDPTF
jgi:hypothetical protein